MPALFVNGAVGDVSPRQRGWHGVAAGGKTPAPARWSPCGRGSRPSPTSAWPPTSVSRACLPAPGGRLAQLPGAVDPSRHAPGPAARPCRPPPRSRGGDRPGRPGSRSRASSRRASASRSRRRGGASFARDLRRRACPTTTSGYFLRRRALPARRATSRAAASTGSGAGSWCATRRSRACGSWRSGARPGRSSGQRVELAGERGLPAGGGVAVDDALA